MSKNFELFELYTGQKIPSLGLEISEVKHDHEIEAILNYALATGIRHFDTAYSHQNERTIGQVFQKWFSSGKIKRDEIYIGAKLPPIGMWPYRVNEFLKISLRNLQLDYVDLYLIQYPVGFQYLDVTEVHPVDHDGNVLLDNKIHLEAIWKGMEHQVKQGRAKAIGLCNFDDNQLKRILNMAIISPAVVQIEPAAFIRESNLKSTCDLNRIQLCVSNPLQPPCFLTENPELNRLSTKYAQSPSAIALRFLIQSGTAAVQNCQNKGQLNENFDIFNFELEPLDVELLQKLYSTLTSIPKSPSFGDKFPGIELHPEFPWK